MRCRPATRATPMLNSSSIRLRRRESVSLGRFQNCNLLEMDHFRRHGVEDEYDQQHLGVTTLLGRTESLDRAECNFIQVKLVLDRAQISRLLTDQLCIGVLDDARTVWPWLHGCSHEVFESLRNSPHA